MNVEEHIQEECKQIDEEESLEDVAVEEGLVVGRTQIDRVDGDGENAQDCNRLVDEPPENALTICLWEDGALNTRESGKKTRKNFLIRLIGIGMCGWLYESTPTRLDSTTLIRS